MKISDQGFTERVTTQTGRTSSVQGGNSTAQASAAGGSGTSDTLQLSNLASQLQKVSGTDVTRTARLNQIAAAVQNGTFQFNASRVSSAIVSESIQASR